MVFAPYWPLSSSVNGVGQGEGGSVRVMEGGALGGERGRTDMTAVFEGVRAGEGNSARVMEGGGNALRGRRGQAGMTAIFDGHTNNV